MNKLSKYGMILIGMFMASVSKKIDFIVRMFAENLRPLLHFHVLILFTIITYLKSIGECFIISFC